MNLNPQKVAAVLFDLDGTLLDSAPDLGFAANQLRIARGMPALPQPDYRPFVGTGARGMLRIALGITPEDANFDDLKEEFFQGYEQCMGVYSRLFDGAALLIRALETSGMKWGIVTNKSERFALPIVANLAEFSAAAVVICGDTTHYSKPHPAPLWEAARRIDMEVDRCIYVGDDERDMLAAQAAGMPSIAAAYGYLGSSGSVEAWKPNAVIKSPIELAQLLGLN